MGDEDRTRDVARRLRVEPTVLALVVGAPWNPARRGGGPSGGGVLDEEDGDPFEDDLRTDRLRSIERAAARGIGVDDLRLFGIHDDDLRELGLLPDEPGDDGDVVPGEAPAGTRWFTAGDPMQLMLGIGPSGSAWLARPVPGWAGPHTPTLTPSDIRAVPGLRGCRDPHGDDARAVRAVRDDLLRSARSEIGHCAVCFRLDHGLGEGGLCYGCMSRWQGVVF